MVSQNTESLGGGVFRRTGAPSPPRQNLTGPSRSNLTASDNVQRGQLNTTQAIGTPGAFGFPAGPLAGGTQNFANSVGLPGSSLINAMAQGRPFPRANVARGAAGLGLTGGLPSPQSLQSLGPSGLEFFLGMLETLLGIPANDILFGAQQPFQGLGQARQGRFARLGAPLARSR